MNNIKTEHANDDGQTKLDSHHSLTLIEGQFSPTEAREVLMTLINSKITFHNRKNLSSMERKGHFNPESKKRVEQLKNIRSELLDLIEKVEKHDLSLEIHSEIDIELKSQSD